MSFAGLWDSLVDAICRPPRDVYSTSELVGGKRKRCRIKEEVVERQDMTLINKKGQRLECSHFTTERTKRLKRMPIVIYCHCNSGSRRDAEEALPHLLPNGITVFALDFAGSGNSQGEWVTLGAHEVDDLEVAVKHLRVEYPEATIGLWGRSMGAVTALLYAAKDPSIAGIVVDSAFARLTELMDEIIEEQRLPIPKPLRRIALGMMRRSVRKRAQFNIDNVSPLAMAAQCHIPALFGHAIEDTFVKMSHSERLYEAYGGVDKELQTFAGDHNSLRSNKFYTSVVMFFHRALLCEDPETAEALQRFRAQEHAAALDVIRTSSKTLSFSDEEVYADTDACPEAAQRELAPPWDRNLTRTFTERQLQAIRDNYEADLQIREQTKGVDKQDPKHALLAHPCMKSNRASMTRLGLSDSETSERGSITDLTAALDRAGDPWEAVSAAGERQSRKSSRDLGHFPLPLPTAQSPMKARASLAGAAASPARQAQGMEDRAPSRHRQAAQGDDCFFELPEHRERSEDDEMLKRAMELSLLEHNDKTATSLNKPGQGRLQDHIPKQWQEHDLEDAEEHMLAEALKRSLIEAEAQGIADSTPAHSLDLSSSPYSPATPGDSRSGEESSRHRRRARGLFWRTRADPNKQKELR